MKNAKNYSLLAVVAILVLFVMGPLWNEDRLRDNLDPSFEEFKALVTQEKDPDKATIKAILAEKDRVVKEGTWWPLIACKAEFRYRDGEATKYRRPGRYGYRNVRCHWERFWQ